MSDMEAIKSSLNKSTVAQLKEHCVQRELPVTPGKKIDLVNRLVLFLKDNPEDGLCKAVSSNENLEKETDEVTGSGEDEVEIKGENADDGSDEPTVEEIVEQMDKQLEETNSGNEMETDKVVGAKEEKKEVKKEENKEAANEEEVSMEGIEESKDDIPETDEKKDLEENTEQDADTEQEKDEEKDKTEKEEFIVIDDSEDTGDKKEKKKERFRRPSQPDSRLLNRYQHLNYRRRCVIACHLGVEDLAHDEIQKLMKGKVEKIHYNLEKTTTKDVNGYIMIVYETIEEASKKVEEFNSFRDEITLTRLAENVSKRNVLEEAGIVDQAYLGQASDRRTLCAHFVPEDTSEEELHSLFPDAKSFLWARDENDIYRGMVFMEYETVDKMDKEWQRVRKEEITLKDQRVWFHTIYILQGSGRYTNTRTSSSPQLLSAEKRADFMTRSEQLKNEMSHAMLSPETLKTLKQSRDKIERILTVDKQEQEKQESEAKKRKGAANSPKKQSANKTEGKADNKKADNKKTNNKEAGNKKADNKKADEKKGSKKEGDSKKPEDKKKKRPYPSEQDRRDSKYKHTQSRQNRPERKSVPYGNQRSQQQKSRTRWNFQRYSDGPRGAMGGPVQQSNVGPSRSMTMNQGFGQQNMGMANPQFNPQATANAVSLLVGLSSILGGGMRRQSGGSGGSGMMRQNQSYNNEEWVGGFNDEPGAKRSRYSDGFDNRRR